MGCVIVYRDGLPLAFLEKVSDPKVRSTHRAVPAIRVRHLFRNIDSVTVYLKSLSQKGRLPVAKLKSLAYWTLRPRREVVSPVRCSQRM
jgi:hypothetical protein